MLLFLLTTLKRQPGIEKTKWWPVSVVIWSHSFCKHDAKSATVQVYCCFLLFKNSPHILCLEQVSPVPVPSSFSACLCNIYRMGFALSRWKVHGHPWKRCFEIFMNFSALTLPQNKCEPAFLIWDNHTLKTCDFLS